MYRYFSSILIIVKKSFNTANRRTCISGVMVSMLTSSVVDQGLDPRSGQPKDYTFSILRFLYKAHSIR